MITDKTFSWTISGVASTAHALVISTLSRNIFVNADWTEQRMFLAQLKFQQNFVVIYVYSYWNR